MPRAIRPPPIGMLLTVSVICAAGCATEDVSTGPEGNPPPVLTMLAPNTVATGASAFTLTVSGSQFIPGSVVRWDGVGRATLFVSATELTTPVLAAEVTVTGVVNVTVHSPAPGGGESSALPFNIVHPLPSITTVSPNAVATGGPAFTLTVSGTGFTAASVVRWDGSDRPTTVVSSAELRGAIAQADIAQAGARQVAVHTPAPGGGTSQQVTVTVVDPSIAAGRAHACASIGTVYCWGSNEYLQLGVASTTQICSVEAVTGPCSTLPLRVSGDLVLSHLSAGDRHSCGLTSEGAVYCWGWNAFGQLGDGTTTSRPAPTLVSGGHRFVALSAGTVHTCGLTTTGVAYCWGAVRSGVAGDSTVNALGAPVSQVCQNPTPSYRGAEWPCSPTPLAVSTSLRFRSLDPGIWGTCGVTSDGIAYCWGWNQFWALGTGDDQHRSAPAAVATSLVFSEIHMGSGHACARTAAGAAHCWGARVFDWGQLGGGTVSAGGSSTPIAVVGGHVWSRLELPVGNNIYSGFTCGITTGDALYCWGSNRDRQLGVQSVDQACFSATNFTCTGTPVLVAVPPVRAVAAGTGFACTAARDTTVYCWGVNDAGQLGDGTIVSRAEPRVVALPGPASTLQ